MRVSVSKVINFPLVSPTSVRRHIITALKCRVRPRCKQSSTLAGSSVIVQGVKVTRQEGIIFITHNAGENRMTVPDTEITPADESYGWTLFPSSSRRRHRSLVSLKNWRSSMKVLRFCLRSSASRKCLALPVSSLYYSFSPVCSSRPFFREFSVQNSLHISQHQALPRYFIST